jgi:beta-glucosidase-like glycosyl hydrolase
MPMLVHRSRYNRVNGVYACENPTTLSTMLKGYYNFSGFVVSVRVLCLSHARRQFL